MFTQRSQKFIMSGFQEVRETRKGPGLFFRTPARKVTYAE
jgi:hypothetical protein